MERSIVLSIRGGARVCVPDSLEQITPYVLLEQEDWFEPEIRFVRGLLSPGARAVDIGANHGLYTFALALAAGPQGRVWACEPTPRTASYLERSISLNRLPQVELLRLAISSGSGTARLKLGEHGELNALAAEGTPGTIDVPSARLDDLVREHSWQDIDFVKIDVEGHEPEVIEGGKAFFESQSPLVMFEISAASVATLHPITRFRSLGYGLYRLVPGLNLLAPVKPGETLDQFTLNLFCCKPDRAEALRRAGLLAVGGAPAERAHAVPGDPLSCHRAAHELSSDPDSRLWLLQRAYESVSREVAGAATLPGLMTHARVAAELGERTLARGSLRSARDHLEGRQQPAARASFLAPDERFDTIASDGDSHAWFECTLAEPYLALGSHSSFYVGTSSLPLLDSLVANPFRSPRTLRARQLIRMRAGMQAGPEPHPLLTERSTLNLNPEYWQSRAIIDAGGSR